MWFLVESLVDHNVSAEIHLLRLHDKERVEIHTWIREARSFHLPLFVEIEALTMAKEPNDRIAKINENNTSI